MKKLVKLNMALTDKLRKIADAIRKKTKTQELLTLDQMPEKILSIDECPEDNMYPGPYEISPTFDEQVLVTQNQKCSDDIRVLSITFIEISNTSNGKTLIF